MRDRPFKVADIDADIDDVIMALERQDERREELQQLLIPEEITDLLRRVKDLETELGELRQRVDDLDDSRTGLDLR